MSTDDPTVLPPDFLERYFKVTVLTVLWSCVIGIISVSCAVLCFFIYKALTEINPSAQLDDIPAALFIVSIFWFFFGKGWIICVGYGLLSVAVLRKTFLNKTIWLQFSLGHLLLVGISIASLFFMPEIMLG